MKNLLVREVLTLRQSFQVEGIYNQKKNYTSHQLRERLESHSTSITFTASSTTNYYRLIRKRVKSYPVSNYCQSLGTQPYFNQWHDFGLKSVVTTSSFFTNTSSIPKVISLPIRAPIMGYSLQYKHCYCLGIQDSIPAACSLCEYTWEVVVCIVLTSKGRLK